MKVARTLKHSQAVFEMDEIFNSLGQPACR